MFIIQEKFINIIPLAMYKKRGWEAPEKNLKKQEGLVKRRQFAIDNGCK